MKRVLAVITYEAYVPEDMDNDQIQTAVENEVENRMNRFRIHVKEYHNEETAEPLFDKTNLIVSERVTIASS
jgi:hypothetical protein